MITEPLSIPNGDVVLEAELVLPDDGAPFGGVVVCHPHPQYGGDMRNNVVVAIIQGLLAQGIAALRFNFRGAGRSTGSYSEGVGERDDALAAFAALREHDAIDPARVAIAGYSFGANIALSLAPYLDEALGVAAVAPPLQGLARPTSSTTPSPSSSSPATATPSPTPTRSAPSSTAWRARPTSAPSPAPTTSWAATKPTSPKPPAPSSPPSSTLPLRPLSPWESSPLSPLSLWERLREGRPGARAVPSGLFSPREKIEMRGPMITTTGRPSPPPRLRLSWSRRPGGVY